MFNMPSRKQPNLTITPFSINPASQATTTYYSSWSSADLAVQYDHRGRLQPYVETSEQRRARLEFLRKREFSRRISAWLEDSSKSETSESDARSGSLKSSSSDTDSLHTIDEDEEAEGEVIYATSQPTSRWGSASSSSSSSPSPSMNVNTASRPRPLRASSRSSSFSSLSSISEEDSTPCV